MSFTNNVTESNFLPTYKRISPHRNQIDKLDICFLYFIFLVAFIRLFNLPTHPNYSPFEKGNPTYASCLSAGFLFSTKIDVPMFKKFAPCAAIVFVTALLRRDEHCRVNCPIFRSGLCLKQLRRISVVLT